MPACLYNTISRVVLVDVVIATLHLQSFYVSIRSRDATRHLAARKAWSSLATLVTFSGISGLSNTACTPAGRSQSSMAAALELASLNTNVPTHTSTRKRISAFSLEATVCGTSRSPQWRTSQSEQEQ